MYKNFIFDVYGTLVDIHTNEYESNTWQKLADTLDFYGVNYTVDELRDTYFSSCELQMIARKAKFKYPEIDVVEVFTHLFDNKNQKATKSLATHLAQEFRAFSTDYINVFDGVEPTLAALKKAGKKLYIVSNAQRCFTQPELTRLGLIRYFDGIVYSSDWQCSKPDAALFNVLISRYKLDRKQCVYIGNDAFCDVEGARNAKIDCLWLKTSHTPRDSVAKFAPKYILHNGYMPDILPLLLK